jgi:AbrB family looped-hinge helix DNA binding protein
LHAFHKKSPKGAKTSPKFTRSSSQRSTSKIGEKGQLTVPKQFREDLGLGNGAPFAVLRLGDGLTLLLEQQRFEQLCEQVSIRQSRAGLTSDDIPATLP